MDKLEKDLAKFQTKHDKNKAGAIKSLKATGGSAIKGTVGMAGFVVGGMKQMTTENMKLGKSFIDGWGKFAENPSKWFSRRPNYKADTMKERHKQSNIRDQQNQAIKDATNPSDE